MSRDDFTKTVREELAKRVAQRCSNSECRAVTSGPRTEPEKSVSIGVAAHITAAAEGGPRFDATITATARSSISNGIWLCQNCAKLIDNDSTAYPADLLRDWKKGAEGRARAALEAGGRDPGTSDKGAACPRCDAQQAILWEQRRTLMRSRDAAEAAKAVRQAQEKISQDFGNRGLAGSGIELGQKLDAKREASEKRLCALVQSDAELSKECCQDHRVKTLNEASEAVRESCTAAVQARSKEIRDHMERAGVGGRAESAIADERRRLASLERTVQRDLDLLLLEAQTTYHQNVAEPKRQLNEQNEAEQRAFALAESTVDEVVSRRIAGLSGARREEAQSSVEKWIGVGLPENLERGIVAGAGILFRVLRVHSPPGCALIDGVAFRLSRRGHSPSLWLPAHHLLHRRGCSEVVYDGQADRDRIMDAVDDYIVERLAAILQHGKPLHEERMVWEREKIAAKAERRRAQGCPEPVPKVVFLGRTREQVFEGQAELNRLTKP